MVSYEEVKIRILFYVALFVGIGLFFLFSISLEILIQIESSRSSNLGIFGLAISFLGMMLSFYFAKKSTTTQIGKQTCINVFSFAIISTSLYVIGNLLLGFKIKTDDVKIISVFLSSPISYFLAGYSIKEVIREFEHFLTKNGTAVIIIVILASITIENIAVSATMEIRCVGTISYQKPNISFQLTENSFLVNGQLNDLGFFAEVPINANKTFVAKNILELSMENWNDRLIDLQFRTTRFRGNSLFLEDFQVKINTNTQVFEIITMENNTFQFHQTEISLKPENSLTVDLECIGTSKNYFDSSLSISVLISHQGEKLREINMFLTAPP